MIGIRKVTIKSVPLDGAPTVAVDTGTGEQVLISPVMRPGKSGAPRPGEEWLAQRVNGQWGLTHCLDTIDPVEILTPRDASDPLAVELLDALIHFGLVREHGAGSTVEDRL